MQFRLTQATLYGLAALAHLGEPGSPMVTSRNICQTTPLPERFLLQVMRKLGQAGLVRSTRGAMGGYTLAKPRGEITLLDVVEAVEGPVKFDHSYGENSPLAPSGAKRLREAIDDIGLDAQRRLASVTLLQLSTKAGGR